MLVVTRKAGQSLLIGEDVEVIVLDVQEDRIKLGVCAPRDVRIIRSELAETEKLNREAAQSDGSFASRFPNKQFFKKNP